jgi:hypothetical protein
MRAIAPALSAAFVFGLEWIASSGGKFIKLLRCHSWQMRSCSPEVLLTHVTQKQEI